MDKTVFLSDAGCPCVNFSELIIGEQQKEHKNVIHDHGLGESGRVYGAVSDKQRFRPSVCEMYENVPRNSIAF